MSVQSIDRAFNIIELLSQEPRGVAMTEISRRLDLNKSTVHRLLSSLRERGYIEKDAETGNYKLGLGFVELASLYLNNLELKVEASPFLNQLTKQTGQTSFLATMDETEIVYIDKVETYNSLRRYTIIGNRLPMHATSLGKAMLSGMSDKEIENLYPGNKLELLTKKTIPTLDALLAEIRQSHNRGYSIDDEENERGTRCVGSPIFDYRGRVIAAVSLAWDGSTHSELLWNDYGKQVTKCAADISVRMGCPRSRLRQLLD